VATTPVNITDWASAYGFALSADALSSIDLPALVVCGEKSHPAMRKLCALVSECIGSASHATIDGAAHFMIATHASEVPRLVAGHARRAEAADTAPAQIAKFSRQNKDALNESAPRAVHGSARGTSRSHTTAKGDNNGNRNTGQRSRRPIKLQAQRPISPRSKPGGKPLGPPATMPSSARLCRSSAKSERDFFGKP